MNAILKLIRLPNLLMLLITVLIYGSRILYPTIGRFGLAPKLTFKDFLSLLFVFACVAAAGYIHNDITDVKTDDANEKRQIVGQTIAKGMAWLMYIFLVLAPIPLIYYLTTEIGDARYLLLYGLVIILLFCYNTFFQRLPLLGNLTVAFLCGFVIVLPAMAESEAIDDIFAINPLAAQQLWVTTIGFALFSFLANLIREIIKDIEDMEGDKSDGYNTLPILIGISSTRMVIICIEVILLLCLGAWIFVIEGSLLLSSVFIVLLIFPLLILIYKTWDTSEVDDFGALSDWLKYYFGLGIIALLFMS